MDGKTRLIVAGVVALTVAGVGLYFFKFSASESLEDTPTTEAPKARRSAPLPPGDPTGRPTRKLKRGARDDARADETGAAGAGAAAKPGEGAGGAPGEAAPGDAPSAASAGGATADAGVAGTDVSAGGGDAESPKGTISKETVLEGIETMRPAVKQCYQKILKEFPEAEGTIKLSFTIVGSEGEGHVDLEKILDSSTLYEQDLHDCLIEELRNVTFPAPQGGGEVKVTYPFAFRAADPPVER